jgi:hypothetical protein
MLRHFAPFALVAASLAMVGRAQDGFWIDRQTTPFTGNCDGELLGFDAARGEAVWFGRTCGPTVVWNGAMWTQRLTTVAPPVLQPCVGAYDSVRQVIVAVFGNQSTGLQTWEWNGTTWQLRQNGGLPARYNSSLAFDAARNVTVLFGGEDGSSDGFADTWTWNGVTWTQVMYGGPSPRWRAGIAYDVQSQRVVLFGGRGPVNGNEYDLGDTWEWNGSQWLNHFGLPGPAPRQGARLAYDGQRQRVLLYGGFASNPLQETWQWQGGAWTQLQPTGLADTHPTDVVYDSNRDVFVVVTASTGNKTWEYVPGNTVPASFAPYGAGCAGPTGVPQLSNVVGSLPRIGSTLQMQLTNLPTSLFNVPLGFLGFDASTWNGMPLPLSLTPLGFTGCDVLLAPVRTDGLQNLGGFANWNVPLPMNAHALGADIYFQGVVLVPGWNPAGFVFTNGGHAVVGSP